MYSWSVNTSATLIFPRFLILRKYYSDIHNYGTAASSTGKLFKPSFRTNLYGKKCTTKSAVIAWNKIQIAFGDVI